MSDDLENNARKPRSLRHYQSLIDQLINEARSSGQFDNLEGQGKPIRTDDDQLVPEADRLGYRMLKANGFSPIWMETRRDIQAERDRAEKWLRRTNASWANTAPALQRRARNEYRAMLTEIRRLMLNYNLTVPPAAGQIELINIEAEMERLGR